jgi:hypothetical protein
MPEKFVNMVSKDGSMTARVGETAFNKVWSKKGWKLEKGAKKARAASETTPVVDDVEDIAPVVEEPSGSEGD